MSGQSINDIKQRLSETPIDTLAVVLDEYREDSRVGVVKLIEQYENKIKKLEEERLRVNNMKEFENKYNEYQYICGIDEVGRGPLAGPVVAAAVILPKDAEILYINDSKKLSEKKREELYEEIMQKAIAVEVGVASADIIDDINILQATYQAMREAVNNLSTKPDILLNDAVTIPEVNIKQVGIIQGDARSVSIAAASIIAKVTRDRMMKTYNELYPEYNFASNKGYGTEEHIGRLKELGPTPIHRESFIKGILEAK